MDKRDVPSLTLTLQESQIVLLADGTLHVIDDCVSGIVHELYTDLRDTTTGASAPKDLGIRVKGQRGPSDGCRRMVDGP